MHICVFWKTGIRDSSRLREELQKKAAPSYFDPFSSPDGKKIYNKSNSWSKFSVINASNAHCALKCLKKCRQFSCTGLLRSSKLSLREKITPNTQLFLVHSFLYSDWIQRDTPYLSVFSSNTGKYGPEVSPYLDTLHAVYASMRLLEFQS